MAVPKGTRIGGRQKGTQNKATAAKAAEIAASGLTPLDYMLSIMRDAKQELALRLDAAKAAAQYVHPRLTAMEAKLTHRDEMTLDELRRTVARDLAAIGVEGAAIAGADRAGEARSKGRLN